MFALSDLINSLEVEQLDRLLFRGDSLCLPLPRVFGGQVLAQSLDAAARTVDSDRRAHSLHAYFLRPGNPKRPIIYDVDPIRDGGSFTTRRVVAKQNGKAIFNCSISFQLIEDGLEHQMAMPGDIPSPESLENDADRNQRRVNKHPDLPRPFDFPIEAIDIRSVVPRDPHNPTSEEPVHGYWFKFSGDLGNDIIVHQTLLTYISDMGLIATGLRPHQVNLLNPKLQGASIDHAMWFHAALRVDDWLYYHMDSPRSGHGRDFNRGSFYTREGVHVASSAQEGLIRLRDS